MLGDWGKMFGSARGLGSAGHVLFLLTRDFFSFTRVLERSARSPCARSCGPEI